MMGFLSLNEVAQMYQEHDARLRKKGYPVRDDVSATLERGWLAPYLLAADTLLYGRWDYWARIHLGGKVPDEPIPPIHFAMFPGPVESQIGEGPGRKMLERCLSAISGAWRGWSSWQEMNFFLDWLLWAFGCQDVEAPQEPGGCAGASLRLYQIFDVWPLLLWPYDHFADLLALTHHGKSNGFYATPHNIVEMMCRMTMEGRDCRAETVNDPACGSGRMLLHASNYSLRLFGQDIDGTLCKVSRVNGFLYAPWLAKPFEWDDQGGIVQSTLAREWSVLLWLESVLDKATAAYSDLGDQASDAFDDRPLPAEAPLLAPTTGCHPALPHRGEAISPALRAGIQLVLDL